MPSRVKTKPKAKPSQAKPKVKSALARAKRTINLAKPAASLQEAGAAIMERVVAAIPNVIMKSEPTLLDVLAKEHNEATGLLDALLSTKSANTRSTLLLKVTDALLPHLFAEEQVFYPLLKDNKDGEIEADAVEGDIEHRLARTTLKELAAIKDSDSADWRAHCKVLKELVSHHIQDEEGSLWNDARKVLGNEKLSELIGPYEKAKAAFKA